ncbi:dolabradiene synthase KSL4, chloroplastic-like [Panicum virgatum]|nr:dolabradiene synthase KSL4, chloroplastic-like [Panicum virgatum]
MGSGSKAFMAYVVEGLGNLLDWDQAMAYQRKNGSFFNSPATTAAAAIHNYNGRALDYLDTLISKFGSSVPTVYPWNAYSRLRMVDTLEKMGIAVGFSGEIDSVLDMIYSSWLANNEEITQDMATCAMAFRLLRLHGYDVASDRLTQFSEESSFHDSVQGHLNDSEALLELYKASQVQILKEEPILENIGSWSAKLLNEQLCSNKISRSVDPAEVEHVLKIPFYGTLDRLEHRWNIEHSKIGGFQMLKSAYRDCQVDEGMVALAADGFHASQVWYQQEL